MNIRMKTPGSHDGKPFSPGDVITVSEKEGTALVARGLAEPAGDDPVDGDAEFKPATRRGRVAKAGDADG